MPKTITSGTLKQSSFSSRITAIPSAAYTVASDTPIQSTVIKGCDRYERFTGLVDVTAVSGATTLDVYIQGLLPDQTAWQDLMHLAQFTPTGAVQRVFGYTHVGVQDQAVETAAMGVGAYSLPIPASMRVWCVLAVGTNMTFSITMEYIRGPRR